MQRLRSLGSGARVCRRRIERGRGIHAECRVRPSRCAIARRPNARPWQSSTSLTPTRPSPPTWRRRSSRPAPLPPATRSRSATTIQPPPACGSAASGSSRARGDYDDELPWADAVPVGAGRFPDRQPQQRRRPELAGRQHDRGPGHRRRGATRPRCRPAPTPTASTSTAPRAAPALSGCTELSDPSNPPWNTTGSIEPDSEIYVLRTSSSAPRTCRGRSPTRSRGS